MGEFVALNGRLYFTAELGSPNWIMGEPVNELWRTSSTYTNTKILIQRSVNQLIITPNPFYSHCMVNNVENGAYAIKIMDTAGKTMHKWQQQVHDNNLSVENMGDLSPGFYLLSMVNLQTGANRGIEIIKQ